MFALRFIITLHILKCTSAANQALQIDLQDGHQIIFNPVGHYATAAEYIHITLDIDVGAHFNYITTCQQQILKLSKVTNTLGETQMKRKKTAELAIATLEDLEESMINHLSAMMEESIIVGDKHIIHPDVKTLPRDNVIYNRHKSMESIQQSNGDMINVEDLQEELFPNLNKLPMTSIFTDIKIVEDSGIFDAGVQRTLFIATEVKNDFNDIVQSAIQNRLSSKAMLTTTTQQVFKSLTQKTKGNGYHLLIENANDIFKLDASYYKTGDKKFKLVVHVPIVKRTSLLEMMQYIPFPLSQQIFNGTSIFPQIGKTNIIAVQRDTNMYKLLGESDLIGCKTHKNTYLCPDRIQLLTNMAETCLGSLFSHNENGILQNCNFGLEKDKEYVYAINNHEFLVHLVEPRNILVECPEESTHLEMSLLTHLVLEEQCKVNLRYHQLQSGNKKSDEVTLYHTQWKWDAMKLFPNKNKKQINEILGYLSEAGIHLFTAKDIQLWQYDVYMYQLTIGNYGLQLGLILFLLCLSITICALFKCHCFGCRGCEVMRRKGNKQGTLNRHREIPVATPVQENYIYRPTAPFLSRV